MSKRTTASYRAAALKGWRARRARLGWIKRRRREALRKWIVTIGYESSRDNSFSLTVLIHTWRSIGKLKTIFLVEDLLNKGHFDAMSRDLGGPYDLRWCAMTANFSDAEHTHRRIRRGHAVLLDFDRQPPGALP